jgi:hypothetical protein
MKQNINDLTDTGLKRLLNQTIKDKYEAEVIVDKFDKIGNEIIEELKNRHIECIPSTYSFKRIQSPREKTMENKNDN